MPPRPSLAVPALDHRPLCAGAAVALLLLSLGVGNPFRAQRATTADPPVERAETETRWRGSEMVAPIRSRPALQQEPSTADVPGAPRVVPAVLGAQPLASHATFVRNEAMGADPVADPDGVGACPQNGLPSVTRRGLDGDGCATWWHADGSITKRGVRQVEGEPMPFVMRLEPARVAPTHHAVPASSH
jgi:hypothetical protein